MLTASVLPIPSLFSGARSDARCRSVRAAAAPLDTRRSLYDVLRVKRDASQTEIKTAYRTLAKLHHPDAKSRFMVDSTLAADFIEIRDAYATLSDPDARALYDSNIRRGFPFIQVGRARFRRWETDQCW